MSVPTQENIRQSLSTLQQNRPLSQQDMRNIAWAFAFSPSQDQLLMEIHAHNHKLAEVLLIFRSRLLQASATDLETAIDHLILHYIINTDGLIPESEQEDHFNVFDAATRYARTMCVDVSKGENEDAVLHLNGGEVLCPGWGAVPGMSAAWSLRQIGPEINRARYGRNDVIPPTAFGFHADAENYSLPNAMTLADCAHLAYFEPAYVEKNLQLRGYTAFRWVENADTDTQAFVAGKDKHLIVCFRGTSSGKDALADVNFFKTDAFGGRGRVHRGFQQSLDSVWPQVQAAVDALGADKKLFFCGHSLGAALAQLAAHRFALSTYSVAGIYVFGSPRVGTQTFKEAYNELLENKTFLHINHQDLVTQLPPMLFGFQYLGGPFRQFDAGHLISIPDAVQEDHPAELYFADLDAGSQEALQQQIEAVRTSIAASTDFLHMAPQQFSGASYGTDFKSGAMDDHGMAEYLFKFGCAIVEGEWQELAPNK